MVYKIINKYWRNDDFNGPIYSLWSLKLEAAFHTPKESTPSLQANINITLRFVVDVLFRLESGHAITCNRPFGKNSHYVISHD